MNKTLKFIQSPFINTRKNYLKPCKSSNQDLPNNINLSLKKVHDLRYGENPHQQSAIYIDSDLTNKEKYGIASARQYNGKEMSYNNYLDADAAYNLVNDITDPACVIIKHTNPCGASTSNNLKEAYLSALKGDPLSAFGGIVAFNRKVDEKLAKLIKDFKNPLDKTKNMFYEIIIAPEYSISALNVLMQKSKNLRILEVNSAVDFMYKNFRQISGGFLYQDFDRLTSEQISFECVSEKQLDESLLDDVKFAWTCVKHIKSNAITVVKNKTLLGMGCGQPNRVKSVELALEKSGDQVQGSVLASDAFFPFSWNDAVEKACKSGVSVIVQPGGSKLDQECIDCCNKYNVVLVMTSVRHFLH